VQYLIPAILTAILTFVGGLLLWQIKRERISLEYDCIGSEIFPRESGFGRYFIIKFINSGNKSIENTKLTIIFPTGTIESVNFSDQKLINDVVIEGPQLSGSLPLLNPKEDLSVTITTIGKPDIIFPTITARSVGVTAVPKNNAPINIPSLSLPIAILALGITVTFFIWQMSYKQTEVSKSLQALTASEQRDSDLEKLLADRKQAEKEREQGKPETEQIVFAILNRVGLSHLMYRLVETGENVTFWKTGLMLMQAFLVDQKNTDKYFAAMNSITELTDMAPSSLGFNLYLLAKMEQFRGNNNKAIQYFEKCKTRTPLMYEHLMAQDPTYNLENLRNWMLKNSK
jgi:nitrogen fixation-related uncharacterized protein